MEGRRRGGVKREGGGEGRSEVGGRVWKYVCMYVSQWHLSQGESNSVACGCCTGTKTAAKIGGGREDLNIAVNPLLLFFIPLIATINTVAHSI